MLADLILSVCYATLGLLVIHIFYRPSSHCLPIELCMLLEFIVTMLNVLFWTDNVITRWSAIFMEDIRRFDEKLWLWYSRIWGLYCVRKKCVHSLVRALYFDKVDFLGNRNFRQPDAWDLCWRDSKNTWGKEAFAAEFYAFLVTCNSGDKAVIFVFIWIL